MKIEFGKVSVEFPYEKYLKKLIRRENPLEAVFLKANPSAFNDLIKKIPSRHSKYLGIGRKPPGTSANTDKPDGNDK